MSALLNGLEKRILQLLEAEKMLADAMKRAEKELEELETLEIPEAEKQARAAALEKNLDDARELQGELAVKIGALQQLEWQIEAMEEERLKGSPTAAPLETPDQKARDERAENQLREIEARKETDAPRMQPPENPEGPGPHHAPFPGHVTIQQDPQFLSGAKECGLGPEVAMVVIGSVLQKGAEKLPSLSEMMDATLTLLRGTVEMGTQLLTETREAQARRIDEAIKAHQQPEQTERENALRELSRKDDVQREISRKEDVQREEQQKVQQEKHAQEREKLEKSLELAQKRFKDRPDLDDARRAELQKDLDKNFELARDRLEKKQANEREQLHRERDVPQI